jgi:hypothetical protein
MARYGKSKKHFYIFAFQGTKPYKGKVIVRGNSIIGESSNRPVAAVHRSVRSKPKVVTVPIGPASVSAPRQVAS